MLQPTLDRPPGVFASAGPDMRPRTADEIVDELISIVTADRVIDPEETRAIQRLMTVMQAVAQQRAAEAQGQMQPPSDETGDFGATSGTEDAANSGPVPGQEYVPGGY